MRRDRGRGILFLVYVVFGIYFLNFGLNFINLPESFSIVSKWIVFIGGILLIFAGIKNLLRSRYYY